MKVYETSRIRNIAVIGHGGAGKTSLVEALLYNAGHTSRLGKVDEGTATTDFFPEEVKRKISVSTALAPCEWKDSKINIVDTPGYSDFFGEVKGALRVVDSVVVVLCAVSGVEVQTEIGWKEAEKANHPKIAFVNKMDRENANFDRVLQQMKDVFKKNVIPLQLPIGSEAQFSGVIDLLKMKACKYNPKDGSYQEKEIPAELSGAVEAARDAIMEAAAEGDDELLIKYLDGEVLTEEEVSLGLKKAFWANNFVPALCGSAINNIGVRHLLDFLVDVAPSPVDVADEESPTNKTFSALVFKTLADPYVGKLSFFRVFSGNLKGDSTVYNANKEKEEKVGQIFTMRGKQQEPLSEVKEGDIAVVAKLQVTETGDTICSKENPVKLEGIEFPEPMLSIAIEPKSKGDEDKLSSALTKLIEADPTLRLTKNVETKETILTGTGETHLDIVLERLHQKYGVDVNSHTPSVPYRETIRGTVQQEGKYKKQTGGRGQYGHVWLTLEPYADGEFAFEEKIFGGAVPKQYFPAVEKGLREAIQEGVLAGYPVTGVKATLYDGSYHPVDSSEMAFKIAASMAFKKGMEKADPVLLEPIMNVEVLVPEQFMGDIIGDLNGKRGRIMGMEPQEGGMQLIKAQVPLAEMQDYATALKSITQGRGSFKMEFASYEEVPARLAEEIIEKRKAEREKE
ncbi:elongation factor G [Thermacetogenium phaeum DSM 12270]|uniref:Elongation factor G n=1 Tax=Thermacetogenium phaeum (strain ATCC BAA-254 / DSM 26808 / PB) TaxID=1089553 RepID=K4LFP5_THEPS|nr:elongation factor G [Thermacetogenium phaeum]AFV11693.1 elongation factor G [Thermacetogenium phaeum DSM 12270]